MQKRVPLRITELEDSWAKLPLKLCVRSRDELSRQSRALLDFLANHEHLQRLELPARVS